MHSASEQASYEAGAVGRPHSGKAKEHDAAVGPGLEHNEFAEVLVIRQ